MGLSTQEQILIEQRVTNEAKSVGAAYLLWFFLGTLGAHRFYLGRTGSGVAQLVLFVLGWLTTFLVIGFALLAALGIWWIVDAFLISAMIAEQKEDIRQRLTNQALLMNQHAEQAKRTVISAHEQNA
ncbi:TM2 domain-containing protein [Rhizobium leucaenae]|jgi:TM2 domain-containing membrane protein YozV|uniref:TM2 domain-containing membrane protein YozV n=1 Tax=Rhizobium leucaenae TaxID=29450 RepID=A0A7W7EKQ5_9HYPH|nr:TM2 domain-containing protein [Rhizobium leucaenae]MBB4567423.1 TM2 domain-containing membrane protein YozV [Rhizobium leucaenae]MBB6303173.1 TM2 domain-containing membrane protein YozV [Rhizobium leucaenae]